MSNQDGRYVRYIRHKMKAEKQLEPTKVDELTD